MILINPQGVRLHQPSTKNLTLVAPFFPPFPVPWPPLQPCRQPPPIAWNLFAICCCFCWWNWNFSLNLIFLLIGFLIVDVDDSGPASLCSMLKYQRRSVWDLFFLSFRDLRNRFSILHSLRIQCQHRSLCRLPRCSPALHDYEICNILLKFNTKTMRINHKM